jgi:PAS domain S-box-containing protein
MPVLLWARPCAALGRPPALHPYGGHLFLVASLVLLVLIVVLAVMIRRLKTTEVEVKRSIASRKQEEADLRERDERFRQVAGAVDPVLWLCEPMASRFLYVSPAFGRIWPYTVEGLYGNAGLWIEAIHPGDLEQVRRNWARQLEGHATEEAFRVVAADGTTRWIFNRSYPVFGKEGRVVRVAGFAEEITEAETGRRPADRIQQARKLEALGTLAGGVAHDFNNLLQTIQGYTQLLLLDKDQDHPEIRSLQAVDRAADRAAGLTRRLLTFGRRVESRLETLDLNPPVRQVVEKLERTFPATVRTELSLADAPALVRADAGQLEQVLESLCANARDAMPEGGCLRIETGPVVLDSAFVEARPGMIPGNYLLLSVSDTGHGMDEGVQERMFEPFFTTKGIGMGSGLGLSLVYGIVKSHGGHIDWESAPEQGTTFRLYWPASAETPAAAFPEPPDMAEGRGETILLVDDEAAVRSLVEEILSRFGYRVLTAPSGEKALRVFEKRRSEIAVVILDLIMPGMGGMQCLEELLRMAPDLKVLVASGYSAGRSARDALKLGACEFVSKPYSVRALLRVVRSALEEPSVPS